MSAAIPTSGSPAAAGSLNRALGGGDNVGGVPPGGGDPHVEGGPLWYPKAGPTLRSKYWHRDMSAFLKPVSTPVEMLTSVVPELQCDWPTLLKVLISPVISK